MVRAGTLGTSPFHFTTSGGADKNKGGSAHYGAEEGEQGGAAAEEEGKKRNVCRHKENCPFLLRFGRCKFFHPVEEFKKLMDQHRERARGGSKAGSDSL